MPWIAVPCLLSWLATAQPYVAAATQGLMDTMNDKTKTGQRHTELTEKQRRFILEYIKDANGTQAAIRAGYSKNGADVAAIRLLGNARISAEIDKVVDKTYQELNLNKTILL